MAGFLHLVLFALAILSSTAFAITKHEHEDCKCYNKTVDHSVVHILNATHGIISCANGYTRDTSSATVFCESTTQGYSWTIRGSLSCQPVLCPATAEHADIIGESGREFGQRRTVRCHEGYRAAGAEGSAICIASKDNSSKGVWHGLHCKPQVCSSHRIPHGQVLTTKTPVYLSTGTVKCHNGYSGRSGANGTVTCGINPDGRTVSWQGFTCNKTDGVNCTHVSFDHGEVTTRDGLTGTVTCLPGFTAHHVTGPVHCLMANEILTWTGYTCTRVSCPPGVPNGRITNTTDVVNLGSIATIQCSDGYTGSGATGTAVCIAGDSPSVGVWHGMECKPVVCDNAMTAGKTTKLVGKYNQQATVQCNIGRDVGSSAPRARCISNGSNVAGFWQYTRSSCLDLVRCDLTTSYPQHFLPSGFQSTLKLHESVTVVCVDGYELDTESVSQNVTCTNMSVVTPDIQQCRDIDECATGTHSCHELATCTNLPGTYECVCNTGCSGDGETCTEITCDVPALLHGTIRPDVPIIKFNKTVGYHCNNGFYLVGDSSRTCNKDGHLHPLAAPQCHNTDECSNGDACHKDAYCDDTVGSFHCTCRDGFRGDGFINCTDIDECVEDTDDCPANSNCVNEPGSFYCECRSGFKEEQNTTSPAGFYCVDINECASYIPNCTNDQGSNCTNTFGAFECPCSTGFNGTGFNACDPVICDTPQVNGLSVLPENPEYNDDVEYRCEWGFQHYGVYDTVCQADGKLATTEVGCTEIVCNNPKLVNGFNDPDDATIYYNERVDYTCNDGYSRVGPEYRTCLEPDKFSPEFFPECHNINECENETLHRCHQFAYCTDRDGSHDCTCHAGYTGDGFNCNNLNECEEGLHNCTDVEVCRDTQGAFECICMTGYTRNPATEVCKINTCDLGSIEHGTVTSIRQDICVYEEKAHYSCDRGYTLSGKAYAECQANSTFDSPPPTCIVNKCDVPGIVNGRHTPNTLQVDYQTKVTYTCNSGYRLTRSESTVTCLENNNFDDEIPTCQDINECLNASACGKNMVCTNLNGSNACDCVSGFTEKTTGEVKVCENINECAEQTHSCAKRAICNDTIGGHACYCPTGHILEDDECNRQPCDQYDVPNGALTPANPVYEDVVHVECAHGYRLEGSTSGTCDADRGLDWHDDEPHCIQIRCNITAPRNGTATPPANSTCLDTVSVDQEVHYTCQQGYRMVGEAMATCQVTGLLDPATPSCQDINECLDGGHNCHAEAFCTNRESTNDCTCGAGYTGDGQTCEDIKECAPDAPPACHVNATCTEMTGSAPDCSCKDGFWGDGIDHCEPLSCSSSMIVKGTVTPSDDVIQHGDYVDYTCDRGYHIDGLERQRCLYGNFSCRLPICKANRCPVITNIDNGYVDSTVPGKMTFHCNTGFRLSGNRVLHCTPEGELDGERPFCQDINECYPNATTEYDFDECADEATCTNTIGGKNCSCNSGFEGDGYTCDDVNECLTGTHRCHPLAHCQNTRGGERCDCGVGSRGNGTHCAPITCKVPNVTHGYCDAKGPVYGFNKTVQCHCSTGYEFRQYEKGVRKCLGTVDSAPVCHQTHCDGPFSLLDGEIRDNNQITPPAIRIVYGDVLHYECNRGHTLVGNRNRTCLGRNTFNSPAPRCQAVHCLVSAPRNGHARPTGEVRFDAHVNYTCYNGYARHGVSRAQCLVNGSWSERKPHCGDIDECSQDELHNCHRYADCFNINGSFICTCKQGFLGNGSHCEDIDECGMSLDKCHEAAHCRNTIGAYECHCLTGYKGDGFDFCNLTYCQSPSGPHLTRRPAGKAVSYNTTVRYTCPLGYNLTGETSRTCLDEKLTGTLPRCEPVICTSPDLPNGNVSSLTVPYDHSIHYECNQGYYIVGLSERTCGHCVDNLGLLVGEMPVCEECAWKHQDAKGYESISTEGKVTCSQFYYPSNTSHGQCINGSWSFYPTCLPCRVQDSEDSSASGEDDEKSPSTPTVFENGTATCSFGYTYVGPDVLTCKGGYYVDIGSCTINKCEIEVPPNCAANVTTHTIVYKEIVEFKCDPGYTLTGSAVSSCGGTGDLFNEEPECQINTCKITKPKNGYTIPDSATIDYRKYVAYECNAGYRLVGDSFHQCTADKELNGTVPSCQDINECTLFTPCDRHAFCNNTNGNFTCTCESGWTGDGTVCTDINECEFPVCPINATCHNTPGSKYCTCNTGFRQNDETGKCDVIMCPVPAPPVNGYFGHCPATIRHSHSITWHCDQGYHIQGEVSGQYYCQDSGSFGPVQNCTPCTGSKYGGEGSVVDPVTGVVSCIYGYYKLDHAVATCRHGEWVTVDVCAPCTWKDAGKKGYASIEKTTGKVTCAAHYEAIPHNSARPYGSCHNKTWVETEICLHNSSCPQSRYMLLAAVPEGEYQGASRFCSRNLRGRMPRLEDVSCVKKFLFQILNPSVNLEWLEGTPSFTYPSTPDIVNFVTTQEFPPFVCELPCVWRDKGREGYMNITEDGDVACLPGYKRIASAREPVCEKSYWMNTAECKYCTWHDEGKPGYAGIDLNGNVTCSNDYVTEYPDGDPYCDGTGWHNTAKCLVRCTWDPNQIVPEKATLHPNGTVSCHWDKGTAVLSGGPTYCDPVSRTYQLNHTVCRATGCTDFHSCISQHIGVRQYHQDGTVTCDEPLFTNSPTAESTCSFNGWVINNPCVVRFAFFQGGED